jgi:hypothetical protein
MIHLGLRKPDESTLRAIRLAKIYAGDKNLYDGNTGFLATACIFHTCPTLLETTNFVFDI